MIECYEDFEAFISERITKLREQRNLSARDMSLSLGFGAGYINNIENKNNVPSIQRLYLICEFFNITPRDFFDNEINAPALYLKLMHETKKMDEKTLQKLLAFIELMKK